MTKYILLSSLLNILTEILKHTYAWWPYGRYCFNVHGVVILLIYDSTEPNGLSI